MADSVNVLRSLVTANIEVYYIGIFDHIKRQCRPRFMTDELFDYLTKAYDYQKNMFDEGAFMAHVLCDAFLSDILRR